MTEAALGRPSSMSIPHTPFAAGWIMYRAVTVPASTVPTFASATPLMWLCQCLQRKSRRSVRPLVSVKCSSLYGPPVSYPTRASRDFKYLHGSSAVAVKTSTMSIRTAMANAELLISGSEGHLAKYQLPGAPHIRALFECVGRCGRRESLGSDRIAPGPSDSTASLDMGPPRLCCWAWGQRRVIAHSEGANTKFDLSSD
jgi:hypothetical protein